MRPIVRALTTLALASGALAGCEATKSADKIREVADIESEQEAKAEWEVLDARARAMEADLERRQRFYQALAGTYEGTIRVAEGDYRIRLTLSPSLPRYVPGDRVRTVEEVASDLMNLSLNVQVVQWNPATTLGSVGCLVTGVRPDLVRGLVNVTSEGCRNFYSFEISEELSGGRDGRAAARLAESIVEGRLESVVLLEGRAQPTTNANVYPFSAARVEAP